MEALTAQEDEVLALEQEQRPILELEWEPDWDLPWQLRWIMVVESRVVKWAWYWWVELSWEVSEMAVVESFYRLP